jgi:hypothetical protein
MGLGKILRRVMNRGINDPADDNDKPDLQRDASAPPRRL